MLTGKIQPAVIHAIHRRIIELFRKGYMDRDRSIATLSVLRRSFFTNKERSLYLAYKFVFRNYLKLPEPKITIVDVNPEPYINIEISYRIADKVSLLFRIINGHQLIIVQSEKSGNSNKNSAIEKRAEYCDFDKPITTRVVNDAIRRIGSSSHILSVEHFVYAAGWTNEQRAIYTSYIHGVKP